MATPDYSLPLATARSFLQVKNLDNLAQLLETEVFALEFLIKNPSYNEFWIKKKSGGKRLIEDPDDILKDILRKLNHYLQNVYYTCRSEAAYAFQLVLDNEIDPRNILSNAKRHVGHDWLLNVDFQDFFHQVSQEEVTDIFKKQPFGFSEDLATLLASLTCYKGRLPMGSPTSPALSNFATLGLDKNLLELAKARQWTYTRFADDLSFSSFKPITQEHLHDIQDLCKIHQFVFNPDKIKFYSPEMTKTVTGLHVADKVSLLDDHLQMVKGEIQKYAHTLELQHRTGGQSTPWIRKFEQQIEGHLEFIRFVEGANSMVYQEASQKYKDAKNPVNAYEPVNWLDMGYWNLIK